MRLDEGRDVFVAVDASRVFDVGRVRVLVAFPEPHQRFMRPGVLVVDRNFNDPCVELGFRAFRLLLHLLQHSQKFVGVDHVGVELDLERGVRRTDLGHPVDLGVADRVGDGERDEEGLKRHRFVDFDEYVLVPAKGVSACHAAVSPSVRCSFAMVSMLVSSQGSSHFVWTVFVRTSSAVSSA